MDNYVITIARGYGSGGKTIGKSLAQVLGIACYDREILHMASDESGINEALFHNADERIPSSIFANFKKGIYKDALIPPEDSHFVSDENLFNYQAKIIKELASTESCVIIGRSADYILRTFPNVVSVNIQAPFDSCVAEVMKRQSLSEKEARRKVTQIDKYRSDYYEYYTGKKWLDATNYDITINSARLGFDRCVDAIIGFTEFKLGRTIR